MKKGFFLIFELILFAGLIVFGQSIKILSPKGGEIFNKIDTMNVKWLISGLKGNIKINLRKADGSGGTVIQASYPANRLSYNYPLASVRPGKYFVKIKQGKIFEKSATFTVQNNIKASIKFIYPKAGDVLYRYDNIIIRWKYIGFRPIKYADISLLKNGVEVASISSTKSETQNLILTKSHPYLGEGFKIKIVAINPINNKLVIGYSQGTFSIKKKETIQKRPQSQKISIPLVQNQNQYFLNQNNRMITGTTAVINAKPDITVKHIKILGYGKIINNKIFVVKDSKLDISLQIRNCIRAQVSQENASFPLIKRISIKNSKFNDVIRFPAKTNIIRIEAYNSFGWTVKKLYCEFIHRNHFERPDLEIDSVRMITLNPKEGDTVEFTATIINKGYKIPRGMHIEVLAEADNDIYNTSLDYRLIGLAHNERMKFYFRFKNKFKHGKHLIVFKIDPKHILDDRYTGNNKKQLSFEVK